jgi:hypothetical protein
MPRSMVCLLGGLLTVIAFLVIPAAAQEPAQECAARLRVQLTEAQDKQADLQLRLQQLDEDLKPENIERTFAGIGSTHPEDLREARRRQLEIQKRGVQAQLETLAATRTRLEAAIARADTESYHQSAGVGSNAAAAGTSSISSAKTGSQRLPRRSLRKRRVQKRP